MGSPPSRISKARSATSSTAPGGTVRASMPGVRRAVRDTIPDVDNLVDEALAAMPDVGEALHEMGRTISDAFHEAGNGDDDREYAFTVEHNLSDQVPLSPGERLVLRNHRGSIQVRTWHRDEARVELRTVTGAHDEETAKNDARRVGLGVDRSEGVLRVEAQGSGSVNEGPGRGDLSLRPCECTRRCRWTCATPAARSTSPASRPMPPSTPATAPRRWKASAATPSSGSATGRRTCASWGGGLNLEARHSKVNVRSVEGSATLRLQHSPAKVRRVVGSLELSGAHGPVSIRRVSGDARLRVRHGPLEAEGLGAGLSVDGSHSPMKISGVGQELQLTTSHGPVKLSDVGGGAVVRASHSPVAVSAVGGQLVLRASRSPVKARAVGGEAMVRSDHAPVELREVAGRVALRCGGGRALLRSPGSEVTVHSQRGDVEIRWEQPVESPCTVQCSRGSVHLRVPRESSLEVLGHVERGRAATDLPLEVAATSRGGHTVSGHLGASGSQLQIEVDRGHLSLMAAPEESE